MIPIYVPAVSKPSPNVLPRNRLQRSPYRLDECLAGTSCHLLEDRFDLREGFLDRIEVRRVSGLEDDASCPRLDQLPHLLALVGTQVIQYDRLPRLQRRSQNLLDVGLKDLLGRRSLHGHRRSYPL